MNDTTAPSPAPELKAGALRLALRPDLGGSIAGLWHDGVPVLRSREAATLGSPREAACYPLVPYSGRLGLRRFRWAGQDYTTRPNFDDSPHSLHGVGWQRPWRVVEAAPAQARLALAHAGDGDWPFAFDAEQGFALGADALELTLQVVNTDARPQPVGLGWHPYFPKRPHSRLHVECSERWETEPATQLPTRRTPCPGIDAELRYLDLDHGYEGWRAPARLRDEAFSLRLASSLPRLVVYTPPLRDYFCVEPVSHVANAIHLADPAAHGLVTLEPGAALRATMRLEVARR